MDISEEHQQLFVLLQEVISDVKIILMSFYHFHRAQTGPSCCTQDVMRLTYSLKMKIPKQLEHMHDLVSFSDATCVDNLRMSRNAFGRLCYILEHVGGLVNTKNVTVSEQVAIFLTVLAHQKKNCIIKHDFKRSGYTISKHFNGVLFALLKLHRLFLVKPTPIEDDITNERWKWFKGFLGALDGTYIPLRVGQKDKPCWEGSAVDSKVLKDAITRDNVFRVPDEAEFPEVDDDIDDDPNISFIDQVEPSQQWTNWRETLATIPRNTMATPPGRMRGRAFNVSNGKSSRRCWTPEEERVLVNALKELLVRGYKANNGFKSGYQNLLEQAMIQAFPGTNIRAEPHINSCITVWRKNFGTISTMQSRSGFGWNDATNMITVDSEEAWNNYVKTDSNARNMSNNEFEDVQSMSFSNANEAGSSKRTDKRKRKVVDVNDDRFIDLMSSFCDKTDERLGDISKRTGFEHDASKSRKAVFDALGDLESSLDME
ncbi:hypothetical protein BUALT_Bualt06G0024200 [Buddleja alternifolia]|uniref:Myb/SANT-like domain-containing protein n=1 Tax=Buddleja alternifolia TaxID=168488 RepID=A0AAV6XN90_9LAMI|nr:hypothetical protein BUALT_Bualt06G0024200 [Buddleja alternifolia]